MRIKRIFEGAIYVGAMPIVLVACYVFEFAGRIMVRLRDRSHFNDLANNFGAFFVRFLRRVFGARVVVEGTVPKEIEDRPFILVSNHQPPLDLILYPWVFAGRRVIAIARKGMDGRGLRAIPAMSWYLRSIGSVFLRRDDAEGNAAALTDLAQRIEANNHGVAIFPQGLTKWGAGRGKSRLKRTGLRLLLDNAPNAIVIPVLFDKFDEFITSPRAIPTFGLTMTIRLFPPILRTKGDTEAVIDACERIIVGPDLAAMPAELESSKNVRPPVPSEPEPTLPPIEPQVADKNVVPWT
jgi:1-acyl-sn-glycerol-3-phosphate acyltransferase